MLQLLLQKFYRNRHYLVAIDCYEISIISNDNRYFPFYVDFFFPVSPQDFYWTCLYIWITLQASYKKPELLITLHKHLYVHPLFLRGSMLLIFLVFCVVLVFFVSSSCVLCNQCCQCLWIVHFWLLLRFSLTFIYFRRSRRLWKTDIIHWQGFQ